MFLNIFLQVFTIFAILLVGVFANKRNILPDEASPYMINLLLFISTPCLMVYSLQQRTLTPSLRTETIEVLVGSAILITVGIGITFLIIRLFRHKPKDENGLLMCIFLSSNTTFIGFPISQALFGDKVFYFIVISNLIWNSFFYGSAPVMMNSGAGLRSGLGKMGKALRMPVLLSIYLGIFLLVTGLKLPAPVNTCIGLIGNITVPLSMLIIGVQLGSSHISVILRNYRMLLLGLLKVTVFPLCMIFLVGLFPFPNDVRTAIALNFLFPCGVASAAVAEQEGKNYHIAAEQVTITTILSLVTIPLLAGLLQVIYPF